MAPKQDGQRVRAGARAIAFACCASRLPPVRPHPRVVRDMGTPSMVGSMCCDSCERCTINYCSHTTGTAIPVTRGPYRQLPSSPATSFWVACGGGPIPRGSLPELPHRTQLTLITEDQPGRGREVL